MSGDDIASIIYLGLLGTVIAGYFLASQRGALGRTLQQAILWGLIFLGVVAAAGLWEDIRGATTRQASFLASGEIVVPRAPDGHYYLTLELNGTPVRFVVDTGATDMVLSVEDAARAGIDHAGLAFVGRAHTANGTVPTARIWLEEVRLGPVVDRNVPASISGGEMRGSLLGMGYLSRFDSLTIADGQLTLVR